MTMMSTTGDRIEFLERSGGFTILVAPPKPVFDDGFHDLFQLGMKFSTLARFLDSLRTNVQFLTDDGLAVAQSHPDGLRLTFQSRHRRGDSFSCTLRAADAETLAQRIEGMLAGSKDPEIDIRDHAEASLSKNRPCRCGSGKKFKKCCYRRAGEIPTDVVKVAEGVGDPHVRFLVEVSRLDAFAAREPAFWTDLGGALGSCNEHDRARRAWQRALEIEPEYPGALLDLAVDASGRGETDDALTLVGRVPHGIARRAVILANILFDADRPAEAIPLYEEAIGEEPDFDLPYVRLVRCLEATRSPLVDFWVTRAKDALNDSPPIAVLWARHLYRQGRLAELAAAGWIDRLASRAGEDRSMLDRRADDPVEIVEAQLWRACGQVLEAPDQRGLEKAAALLPAFARLNPNCDPAKAVLTAATMAGSQGIVELAWKHLCDHCRSRNMLGGLEFYMAAAAYSRGAWPEVLSHSESCLASEPENLRVLGGYWWALDEVGRSAEAIALAEKTRSHIATFPAEYAFHLDYNIGLMCGKEGLHGKAQYYYESQVLKYPVHPWAVENLIVTNVLNGNPSRGRDLLGLWKQACESPAVQWDGEAPGSPPPAALALRSKALGELIDLGMGRLGSTAYSLEVSEFRKTLAVVVGSDVRISREVVSKEDVLRSLRESGEAERAEVLRGIEMAVLGDQSSVISRLLEELPGLRSLPTEAQLSLIEGERRLCENISIDSAPEVVCFAKAAEVALKTLVFDAFKAEHSLDVEVNREIEIALSDRYKQVHNFVRFVERGQPIELGTMLHTLRLSTGKTAQELSLLGALRAFVIQKLGAEAILEPQWLSSCDKLVKLRNPAAHANSFGVDKAREARTLSMMVLRPLQTKGEGPDRPTVGGHI